MLLLVTVGNIAGMTSAQMLHLFQSPSLHSGPERTVLIPGDILSLEHWNRSWSEAGVELEQVIDFYRVNIGHQAALRTYDAY